MRYSALYSLISKFLTFFVCINLIKPQDYNSTCPNRYNIKFMHID
uniref:Uncharacterized protein n=1 Tax=Rhizophora mucronata TaxID=61149 RepID=A0A2P2QG50_RHIMU